jgi:phytanoyl-CoA hydroxylase
MSLRDRYLENGYVIVRGALPDALLASALEELERFKRQKRLYFTQSTHSWAWSKSLTSEGFLIDSIQSPTKQWTCGRGLRRSVTEIICSQYISKMLAEISGFEYFVNWQNMLFDKSAGTVDHSDTWYLDTKPSGFMIAAWIALEDIHVDAGRFFVVPKSNQLRLPEHSSAVIGGHYDYAKFIDDYVEGNGLERYAPDLRAGDVLFWHPFTIHGAFNQSDERRSRKSLTAHYHPVGMPRNRKAESPSAISKYMGKMRKTFNPYIFLDNADPSDFDFCTKSLFRHVFRSLRGKGGVGQWFMDRELVRTM